MHSFRLHRGDDLRAALEAYAQTHQLAAAAVVACVGCVSAWRMRCADGVTVHQGRERAEIVSLTGTLSMHGAHLHISLAREDLSVIGGHLMEGCIINTTAEIVLLEVPGVSFTREPDAQTGYRELVIRTKHDE